MTTAQFLIISVVVLIVAIVIFAGMYFYRKYSAKNTNKEEEKEEDVSTIGIKGGNEDEPIQLGYKFVKPQPVSNTPMTNINDTVNEYQEVNVDVGKHDISLINDLTDDYKSDVEEDNGFELPYDENNVLVIEDVSAEHSPFGGVMFSVVTSSSQQSTIKSNAKVEVIEEKTIDNNYITGGNADEESKEEEDNEQTTKKSRRKKKKHTSTEEDQPTVEDVPVELEERVVTPLPKQEITEPTEKEEQIELVAEEVTAGGDNLPSENVYSDDDAAQDLSAYITAEDNIETVEEEEDVAANEEEEEAKEEVPTVIEQVPIDAPEPSIE